MYTVNETYKNIAARFFTPSEIRRYMADGYQ